MNRTNSVEPVFSQPLQVTYHQLLQNKTKIEDELYQTQRQLRRKEGEYLKKIAVYEQKIEQLQEYIDEFREREENTKSMYEKILSALNNSQDKQNQPGIDLERVQEMLMQMQKSHQNSPTNSEKSMNSSFRRRRFESSMVEAKDKEKQQIENLETSLQQLGDANSRLKSQLLTKEKENHNFIQQIDSLKKQIDNLNFDHSRKLEQTNLENQKKINEIETLLKKEHEKETQALKNNLSKEKVNHENQIIALQEQIKSTQSQINKQTSNNNHIEKINQKEMLEIKSLLEKSKKDIDNLLKERDQIIKEKDLIQQSNKEQEQQITKLKKQQTSSQNTQNESIKKLKDKIQDLEKELSMKIEEAKQSKAQVKQLKSSTAIAFVDRKSSGQGSMIQNSSVSSINQLKNVNVGSKDQQILVDIQTTEKVNRRNGNFRVQNRSSNKSTTNNTCNSSKMFTQPITVNLDCPDLINPDQTINTLQKQSNKEQENAKTKLENLVSINGKISRNSNGNVHSSMIHPQSQQPAQQQTFNEKPRNQTPNYRQYINLDDTNPNISQMLQSNRKRNPLDDESLNNFDSSGKSIYKFKKYINPNDECRNSDQYQSRCNSHTNVEQTRRHHFLAQRTSSDRMYDAQQRFGSANPYDRYLNEGDRALLTSLEIEQVVRKMLDQVYNEKNQTFQGTFNGNETQQIGSVLVQNNQYHNMQTPSQNVSFSVRKNEQQQQMFNNSKYSSQQSKSCITIDKEFLSKLESSLKKLAKRNEKIKQIMKEKETLEKECLKLKQKVKNLKEEKSGLLQEREGLILINNKMEYRLKQAQVLLNLEDMQNPTHFSHQNHLNSNNNTTIYELSHNSSQKTLVKHYANRDISPSQQSNLTLNIIQDQVANNERYKNPPMSCRVNDSYDVSLRLNGENSYAPQGKRHMFHNTLDKSMLDQSLITIKRDQMMQQYQNQNLQASQFTQKMPGQQNNRSFQSKFLPQSSSQQLPQPQLVGQHSVNTTYRGKTPTLQINLSQSPNQELYCIGISTQGQDPQDNRISNKAASSERDDSSSVMTSRNFSRSTTNLLQKKSFSNHPIINAQQTNSNNSRQLFKYQSNRDQTQIKNSSKNQSYMNSKLQNITNMSMISAQNSNQKNQCNYSSIGAHENNSMTRERSPQINLNQTQTNYLTGQTQIVMANSNSMNILRRMNPSKAKDRYYTNKRGGHQQVIQIGDPNRFHNVQACYQIVTFDEEDDYAIDEQTIEEDQNLFQSSTFDQLNREQRNEQPEEEEYPEDLNTDENDAIYSQNSDSSSINIKVVQVSKKNQKKLRQQHQSEADSTTAQYNYPQTQIQRKKDEGVLPSDERDEEEESVQYKLLNNSNFIPSMHSRYINDESQ